MGDHSGTRRAHTVRIESTPSTGKATVTFLGPFSGCNTHHVRGEQGTKGRSHYCPGQGCQPALHKLRRQWKAYAPALVYRGKAVGWVVCVWEFTEHAFTFVEGCEPLRGTRWDFERKSDREGHMVVCAEYRGEYQGDDLYPQFDHRPVVRRLYDRDDINFTTAPPILPRMVVEAQQIPPPEDAVDDAAEARGAAKAAEWKRLRQAASEKDKRA